MFFLQNASRYLTMGLLKRGLAITLGAGIAAFGLEAFLVPNRIIDGGIVGISIMSSAVSELPLGLFLFLLNLPFIYLGWKRLGKLFALSSLYGVVVLSILTTFIHPSAVTTDSVLAAVFGGAILGLGVGTVIRAGGALDGTEIIAVLADKKFALSIGEIIMFINFFILSAAGFVFDWDRAMYSLIAYLVAFKVIDVTIEGMNGSKFVWISTLHSRTIGDAIEKKLGRKVTYTNGKTRSSKAQIIFCVITRIEEQKIKSLVKEHDPDALVVINNVHEVMGRSFTKKRARP